MQRLVWEYVTKAGAVIVQYVPEGLTLADTAACASGWLETLDQVRDEETEQVKPRFWSSPHVWEQVEENNLVQHQWSKKARA